MSLHRAASTSMVICIALTSIVAAQKGGKPKPVDRAATATFRCSGPTATSRQPPGTVCGPESVSDAITGDGAVYVGNLTTYTGAIVRFDGELDLSIQTTDNRMIFLNFEHQLSPATGRKNFSFADLRGIGLNTNVIDPSTGLESAEGALSIPVGATWPTRIKGNWTDPYGVLYTIRFNPRDYPGSTHAWVRRNTGTEWVVYATNAEIARLVSPGVHHQGPLDEGSYTMPFEITFRLP